MSTYEERKETVRAILNQADALDLDDKDVVPCEGIALCSHCPSHIESPTEDCLVSWFRDWWFKNVIEVQEAEKARKRLQR